MAAPKPDSRPSTPQEETVTWARRSADGSARLEQTRSGTSCTSRCITSGGTVWSSTECLTDQHHQVFLTNDCEVVISVIESPKTDEPWAETVVLNRWKREKHERDWRGGPMLASSKVETTNGRYRWLNAEPRYLRDGAGVEFTVRTGMRTRLPFRDSTALGEERYENAGSPDEPRATAYQVPALLGGMPVTPYAPEPPAPPAQAPVHAQPPVQRTYKQRWCFSSGGCADIPLQAPPTIKKDSSGALTCRNEGEACGTNADCCGADCTSGACR
ncbi:MAG: hypothetical protein JNK82_26495 [Myxococcaceae bacterium]|nr:hypothetical protein [Myxococcaceae bacterium]